MNDFNRHPPVFSGRGQKETEQLKGEMFLEAVGAQLASAPVMRLDPERRSATAIIMNYVGSVERAEVGNAHRRSRSSVERSRRRPPPHLRKRF